MLKHYDEQTGEWDKFKTKMDKSRTEKDKSEATKPVQKQIKAIPEKENMLIVTTSIGLNTDFYLLAKNTGSTIRTEKADTIVHDIKAKNPEQNFNAVVKNKLEEEPADILILQGGSVEITNMDTQNDPLSKFEYFKQEVNITSENMFKVAEMALSTNSRLKKVIILDRIKRFDKEDVDPYRLKSQLSKLGNSAYLSLLSQSKFKNQIFIGHHNLQNNNFTKNQIYGSENHPSFDGINTTPYFGKKAYSQSLYDILFQYEVLKKKLIVPTSRQNTNQWFPTNNQFPTNNWQWQNKQNNRNTWHNQQQLHVQRQQQEKQQQQKQQQQKQQQHQQKETDSMGFNYNIPTSNPFSPIADDWYTQVETENVLNGNQGNW